MVQQPLLKHVIEALKNKKMTELAVTLRKESSEVFA